MTMGAHEAVAKDRGERLRNGFRKLTKPVSGSQPTLGSPPASVPEHVAVRLSLLYAAVFLQVGVTLPFFALWLDARGLSAGEIAVTLAAPQLLRIVSTPALAYAADRFALRKPVLVACLAVSLAAFIGLAQQSALWPIVALYTLASAATSGAMPLAEATTLRLAAEGRADYGRVRLWGSVAFIVASVLAGPMVKLLEAHSIVWLMSGAAALALAAGCAAPRADGGPTARPRISGAIRILTAPRLLALFAAGSLVQASHAVYYAFASLHWREQGLGEPVIGGLWAWGVVCEVGLFWGSDRLFGRFGPALPLAVGAAASVLRWTAMAADPPLAALIVLQAGHALTFAAAHVGAVRAAARVAPALQATAQSVYAALNGLTMAAAMAAAGPLYRIFGSGAYLGAAALALVGLGLIVLAMRWPDQVCNP